MKVSLNWIKDYVDLPADLSPEQLSSDLTMRTVEVEDIENRADSLKGVLVGTISSVAAHPDADRLRVVQVDVGKPEELQAIAVYLAGDASPFTTGSDFVIDGAFTCF